MSQFDDLVAAFLSLCRDTEFDPSQKRADDGEWTNGGGSQKRSATSGQRASRALS
jgi:hypothetical protein